MSNEIGNVHSLGNKDLYNYDSRPQANDERQKELQNGNIFDFANKYQDCSYQA